MRFLFDFISPYSYVAWKRVHALAAGHGRTVEPVPVLFAALLDHHGHKGPAEIPSKRDHMARQLLRIAAREGIPFTPPPAHPFNPVAALCVACLDHPERRRLIDVLFDAVWAGGPGVAEVGTIARVLDAAGFPGDALATEGKRASPRLRANTREAIEAGVFGVPTILVDGELFWGFDSFPDVDAFLAGHDRIDAAALAKWRALPVGAVRGGPLHGLASITVTVTDLDRTVRFYGGLGYSPSRVEAEVVHLARRGGLDTLVLERGEPRTPARFGFRLRDATSLEPLAQALVAAGGSVERRDGTSIEMRDPDGHQVTLWFV